MTHSRTASILLLVVLWSIRAYPQLTSVSKTIGNFMDTLHNRGQFNGSILVSAGETILYRNSFGTESNNSRQKLTPETATNIASLSKQFTAMIILMLAEQNKLRYDDLISKYLQELKDFAAAVTIRHLLTHTSGIPDVGDLGIDRPGLSNKMALNALEKLKTGFGVPGLKYQYSNTGYLLLATIAERVSGQDFRNLVNERILYPLAMKSTSVNGTALGMGGMTSTVDDLLKWDKALYSDKLVGKSTLDTAFKPYPVKQGTSTYGFGWNITLKGGNKFVWHTGNTENFRAFIGRLMAEEITMIMLTNKGNSKRLEIADAILNIIHEMPFSYPKTSIAEKLYADIGKLGIQKTIEIYLSLKNSNSEMYDMGEGELNSLGYRLLSERKNNDAIQIFELNTKSFPASSNAFDSLADAYRQIGNKDLAIKYYKKAIELDPSNLNSINMLKKIQ